MFIVQYLQRLADKVLAINSRMTTYAFGLKCPVYMRSEGHISTCVNRSKAIEYGADDESFRPLLFPMI